MRCHWCGDRLAQSAAMASPIVVDFANNAGLGISTGTTATINQNGIRMSFLSGTYSIRSSPTGDHSLDLLDMSANPSAVTVQFDLLSGLNFIFLGFDLVGGNSNATITSDRGGSSRSTTRCLRRRIFPAHFGTIRAGSVCRRSQEFDEFVFRSFTFDDQPTISAVPVPAALPLFASGFGMVGLFGLGRKRKSRTALAT